MNILSHLKIGQVIGLGVGAGANVLCRLAMHSPDRVLGVVAIQPTASAASVMETLKVENYLCIIGNRHCDSQQSIVSLKLGSIDHGPDTDQFLVYHKFGSLVEKAEDKLEAVENYKKQLHTDINPRLSSDIVVCYRMMLNVLSGT